MTEKNKFQKKFERLPEEAQSVIDEFDFEEVFKEIKNEYSLSEHQVQVFDGEVAAALVLDRHPNNMKENLIAPDNGETFNPELADDLHFEFHARILEPIMQEMEKGEYLLVTIAGKVRKVQTEQEVYSKVST